MHVFMLFQDACSRRESFATAFRLHEAMADKHLAALASLRPRYVVFWQTFSSCLKDKILSKSLPKVPSVVLFMIVMFSKLNPNIKTTVSPQEC